MSIKLAVENQDKLSFVIYRYSGHIVVADVFDSIMRAAKQFPPDRPYRELLIFEHDTDLSDFHPESLATFMQKCTELYRQLKLGPRTAAAVLDESMDAKLIMPLFNALSLTGGGADLSFRLFTEIEPALNWLGIPSEDGLKIISRVA
jgi:hypothetical protein